MIVFIVFIVWAALLFGLTGGVKYAGRLFDIDESPPFVRALPLVPFIFGGITGAFVLPALATELGLSALAAIPLPIFPLLGFGAGGVAGSAYKVLHQTILGKDRRLLSRSGISIKTHVTSPDVTDRQKRIERLKRDRKDLGDATRRY